MSKLNTLYKFLCDPKNQDKTTYLLDNAQVIIAQDYIGVLVCLHNYKEVGWQRCSSLYQHEFLKVVSAL